MAQRHRTKEIRAENELLHSCDITTLESNTVATFADDTAMITSSMEKQQKNHKRLLKVNRITGFNFDNQINNFKK